MFDLAVNRQNLLANRRKAAVDVYVLRHMGLGMSTPRS
jgi:hypothetical protein